MGITVSAAEFRTIALRLLTGEGEAFGSCSPGGAVFWIEAVHTEVS